MEEPLRFVVLRHEMPVAGERDTHWDLMLQREATLRTWELPLDDPQRPFASNAKPLEIRRLADHRLAYLDYQGPLSGDRGHVTQWAAGRLQWLRDDADTIIVLLDGQRLQGELELRRQADGRWLLAWRGITEG